LFLITAKLVVAFHQVAQPRIEHLMKTKLTSTGTSKIMKIGAAALMMWAIECNGLASFVVGLLTLSLGGAILCYKFDQHS